MANKSVKETVDPSIQAAIDNVLAGLNVDFGGEEQAENSLPWIQGNKNKPELDSEVCLCFPPAVLERLSEEAVEMLQTVEVKTNYSNQLGTALKPVGVRWVILAQPAKGFAQNKHDNRISKTFDNMNWGADWKSASKLHLACLVGNELMTDDDGEVQVWTLKLSGMQGQWINGKDKKNLSIVDFNKRIKKAVNKKGWWTHLVSVELDVFPEVYASSSDAKLSSVGLRFGFVGDGNPKPLSSENQADVFRLISSQEFKELVADPFYVGDAEPSGEYESEEDFVVPEEVAAAATTLQDVSF